MKLNNQNDDRKMDNITRIDINRSIQNILKCKNYLINYANENLCTFMHDRGGGVINLRCKIHDQNSFSVNILLDVVDAMGANTINTTLEGLKPFIMEKLIYYNENIIKNSAKTFIDSSPILMSICSNLTPERITRVGFKVPVEAFKYRNESTNSVFEGQEVSGLEVCQRICMASRIAKRDLFRAVTHNKGIMNGIDAVLIPMGQDFRAVEAACHVYSIYRNGKYQSLSDYYLQKDANNRIYLCSELEIPLSLGTKGGVLGMNPLYQEFQEMMKIDTSKELAQIVACIGLANNLAAVRALVTEGIQKGHMKLHAKNLAASVGIPLHLIDKAVSFMASKNKFVNSKDLGKKQIQRANFTLISYRLTS